MKILGIYCGGHGSGCSLIENNEILACYTEERFSRIKTCYDTYNFPTLSLNEIQKDFDIDIFDPNLDIVSAKPVKLDTQEIKRILNFKNIKLYSHHYSHACGAYYTSGFDENTLIVSIDGGDAGDDNFEELNKDNLSQYSTWKLSTNYGSFYGVKNGKIYEIDKKLRYKNGSPASLWGNICHVFNFLPQKDEGKIMGLAPQGHYDENWYNFFKFFHDNDSYFSMETLIDHIRNNIHNKSIEKQLEIKKIISYSLQEFTNDVILKHIHEINKKYGPFKNLCLTGGLFSNVKLNQRINEYLSFEDVWVYPVMTDDGLCLGAAISHAVNLDIFKNRKIDNVFWGKKYTKGEINEHLSNFQSVYNKNLNISYLKYDFVGDLLMNGKVIGLFNGSAEYGPRALGNRSIMVEPTKKETHEYINKRLNRDEIMPFAPIILEEKISEICHYYKSHHTSEFMTMCYTVKDEWIDRIPAVINIYDKTARPQIVNKDRHKHFYNILSSYYQKSNIPVLMNTSFNGHGEPIINSPREALEHLSKGTIDYLIIDDKICFLQNE